MKAVRFEEYGDVGVLRIEDVPAPEPGPGEVVVRVVTAGTNPGEASIRSGAGKDRFPARFPEGQGSDLAGVLSAVGEGVTGLAVGQPVVGLSDGRNAQAEYALLPADRVVPKPESLDWAAAATLYVAGTTALVMIDVTHPQSGETVAISGAAGGVGAFVTQLAIQTGARVLAVAGEANHERLRAWGAEPIAYGDGLEQRLRDVAPDGIQAFLDTYGGGYVELALRLGVPKDRVETITDFAAAGRLGTVAKGMAALGDPVAGVTELAHLVADGVIEVPIKGRFPLDQVQEAYRAVESRSGLGKIVLDVSAP
ncbi:NADP-dependent oxidoreductase [Amnibacterium sp.]|uniref:NADP-dependent oxidoreductase n=1 Tax=Amnibacterium sp. TaxID=1872496 RepID=UPI00262DBA4A|nr:NADP-dependent oxidoreductase [Amnibacterium sp.]MCU1473340.1 NADPH:quinone reductase [Amnibacterium sp.]